MMAAMAVIRRIQSRLTHFHSLTNPRVFKKLRFAVSYEVIMLIMTVRCVFASNRGPVIAVFLSAFQIDVKLH